MNARKIYTLYSLVDAPQSNYGSDLYLTLNKDIETNERISVDKIKFLKSKLYLIS